MTEPYYSDESVTLHLGDALTVLREMPDESVNCCVTSPPYFGLRDYGVDGQLGLEDSPAEYVASLAAVFAEVQRVLTKDGTLWLNLGDCYSGRANGGPSFDRHRGHGHRAGVVAAQRNLTQHAPYKSLLGMPWRVAFALIDAGWTLRNEVVWHKPNGTPESVQDRFMVRHETVFFFAKSRRNYFFADPAAGDVWRIPVERFTEAHFATMPTTLAMSAVIAGCAPGRVVLDPFHGSGTTAAAALRSGHRYVGIDLRREYLDLSLRTRLAQTALLDGGAA